MNRIKDSYTKDEKTPPNLFTDHEWLHYNRAKLLEQYGEKVIVIYKEQVIGVGDTYQEAVDDAERNLPPDMGEVTPIVELLGPPCFLGGIRLRRSWLKKGN